MSERTERLNELLALCSDDLDDKISAHMGLDLSDPVHEALLLRIRCDKLRDIISDIIEEGTGERVDNYDMADEILELLNYQDREPSNA